MLLSLCLSRALAKRSLLYQNGEQKVDDAPPMRPSCTLYACAPYEEFAPARCARSMNPCRANTYQQPVARLAMARVRRSLARSGGSRCRSGSLPIHTSSARACTARRCGRKPSSRRLASGSRSTSRPRSFRARHSATGPTRAGWRPQSSGSTAPSPGRSAARSSSRRRTQRRCAKPKTPSFEAIFGAIFS
eukprot:COSAG06_NODE_12414_length_1385_cov_1.090980_2_plen_190_part_00